MMHQNAGVFRRPDQAGYETRSYTRIACLLLLALTVLVLPGCPGAAPIIALLGIRAKTVPDGTVGQAYDNTVPVSGGTAPYGCSVSAGALPNGLTIGAATSGCEIKGTPTANGTSSFTLKVTDSSTPEQSATQSFSLLVNPGSPSLTALSPSSAVVGAGGVTVTITGTGFVTSSVVNFGSNNLTPSSVSTDGTQITVAIPAADLTSAGTTPVTVTNPGAPASNALTFTVNNPVPTISSLSQGSAVAGSGDFQLTINGTNFVSGAFVGVGSRTLIPSAITSTQITVTVPSSLIYSAGTITVSVADPTPGGGASNTEPLIVNDTVKANYANGPIFTAGDDSSVDDVATGIALSNSEGDMNLLNLTDLTWSETTQFGSAASAALSGDGNTALIGTPSTGPTGSGTATVFSVQNLNWPTGTTGGTPLVPSSVTVGPLYGQFVALSEDGRTAAVGDPSSAVVWVFTKNRGAWSGGVQLSANGFGLSTGFGSSVSLSGIGDILLVGAPNPNTTPGPGQAFIFTRPSSGWTTTNAPDTTLQASGASSADQEGFSVALTADGNNAFIGAPGANSDAGLVLLFKRNGITWSQSTTLSAKSGVAGDALGTSVSASSDGSTAVAGAPGANSGQGAAYVFQVPFNATQNESQILSPFAGLTIDGGTGVFTSNFGIHVSISNDGTAIVTGGTGSDASGTGQKISGLFK